MKVVTELLKQQIKLICRILIKFKTESLKTPTDQHIEPKKKIEEKNKRT